MDIFFKLIEEHLSRSFTPNPYTKPLVFRQFMPSKMYHEVAAIRDGALAFAPQ